MNHYNQLLKSQDFDMLSQKQMNLVESKDKRDNISSCRYGAKHQKSNSMNKMAIRKTRNGMQDSDYDKMGGLFDSEIYKTKDHFKTIYSQDFQQHQTNQKSQNLINRLTKYRMSLDQNKEHKVNQQRKEQKRYNKHIRTNSYQLNTMKTKNKNQMFGLNSSQIDNSTDQQQNMDLDTLINQILGNFSNRIEIENFVNDNYDYVCHIFKYCKCFQSESGTDKCDYELNNQPKMRFKQGLNSMYNRSFRKCDYQQYQPIGQLDQRNYIMNHDSNLKKIDLQSINKQDYVKKMLIDKIMANNEDRLKIGDGDLGKSTYNLSFYNWNQKNVYRPNVKQNKSILDDLPFQRRTSYNQQFNDFYQTKKEMKNDNQTFRTQKYKNEQQPPMPQFQIDDFNRQTTTGFNHSNPNVQYQIPKRNLKQQYVKKPNTYYDGQYKSSVMRDYKKNDDEGCAAARKMDSYEIKNKIMERIDHIMTKHSVK